VSEPVSYDPRTVESAAQSFWASTRAFEVSEQSDKPKYYCLSMLPYPSGALHMGHVRNYTIGDVISRHKRMTGHNVLQPMGWDAFGLPAENAAIKNKTAPAKWTYANIEHMRAQLQSLGYAIDWSREFATCKPDYYMHEQRMFVRLLKKGVAYRKNSVVNWDPVDQTVLANEQVIDGRGWRTGALVEKREIPQWFLRITDYAQQLLDELHTLDGWPDSVKTMQRNWIGRSEGLEIQFRIDGEAEPLTVFTTRPDTLMGVTFISIAGEHPLALKAAAGNPELAAFLADLRQGGVSEAELETQEKRGMATGLWAIHPVTGEDVPVYVANFVLMGYGTGAVMAVPAHDQRDWEFAKAYGLPVKPVIVDAAVRDALQEMSSHVAEHDDPMAVALGGHAAIDVVEIDAAVAVVREYFRRIDEEGAQTERGWLINSGRLQRHGLRCRVRCAGLEVRGRRHRRAPGQFPPARLGREPPALLGLPDPGDPLRGLRFGAGAGRATAGAVAGGRGRCVRLGRRASPIKSDPEWRKTTCPQCGGAAERETDTFDTFMESSWYYARYTSPGATDMVDERANYWLPVDQYIGGIEHAILHLMYFRFYHKLLRDAGLVGSDEPATRLLCQGMVIADTFYREDEHGGGEGVDQPGRRRTAARRAHARHRCDIAADGLPVLIGGTEKMSKSKNNGVDPQVLVDKYGADTVRLFSMFAAPPEQSLEWNESGVEGMARFLRRLWRDVHAHVAQPDHPEVDAGALDPAQKTLRRHIHEAIQKVGDDYGRRHSFNTAIAALMELLNHVGKFDDMSDMGRAVRHEAFEAIVLLLNPITPHISHALWQALGHAETLLEDVPFPNADPAALVRDALTLAVQVNGKLRGTIEVVPDAAREVVEAAALADPHVAAFVAGKEIRKVVVVPGKIVNIVVAG
jgi:leucyl-tRNA synthetase